MNRHGHLESRARLHPHGAFRVGVRRRPGGDGQEHSSPSSGYVRVGPDSIFYEVAGRGPTLILIHDGLIHREVWDAQFRFFSDKFTVVRFDRRGTALPPRRPGPTPTSRIWRPCTTTSASRSRGGNLPPDLPPSEVTKWYATQDPYEIHRENRAATPRALELVTKAPMANHHNLPGSVAPPPPALPRLGGITVPTLILVGAFDIPDVHAHAGAINAGIPGSQREIIPRAGHLTPLEQPDVFNEVVMRFLERAGGGA